MNILVIGGGGREHAIICGIKKNLTVNKIFALPGNAGIAELAECVDISAVDINSIVNFAVENKIDFVVVAPDDPLALGAVDKLHEKGIACFGPDQAAARIESSKVFSKDLMNKYNIPTANYEVFSKSEEALNYVKNCKIPIVVKADGLALGKGVLICLTRQEAENAVKEIMLDKKFGKSGNRVVIEEFLEGPEVSVLSFTDGKTLVPMVSSMDHKRALDGDKGLNTGGMGCIAPNPYYTEDLAKLCMEKIFIPTINAMNSEGCPFKGCLYFGLILTKGGPKVIEYNCRFGDPETQVVLPLLKSDLLTVMQSVEAEKLNECSIEFDSKSACCIMLASGGYPQSYKKGMEIDLGDSQTHALVFHSGTTMRGGKLLTNGGRVIGVCSLSDNLKQAIDNAYEAAKEISFNNVYYRNDIGKRALSALK